MANSVEHLQAMRTQLQSIYEHLPRFGVSTEVLPIIDILDHESQVHGHERTSSVAEAEKDDDTPAASSVSGKSTPDGSNSGEAREQTSLRYPHSGIPGLRVFRECVRNDIEQTDRFLEKHALHRATVSPSAFSTNAPYLVAVWNELVRASRPVVAVDKTFPVPLETKNDSRPVSPSVTFSRKGALGAKVDIVADNGRQWIRVNTIRNTRLLAEFREIDSYINDSLSEEEHDEEGFVPASHRDSASSSNAHTTKPAKAGENDNSLILMGRALFCAAQAASSTVGGNETTNVIPPKVILRLTRLQVDVASLNELESDGLKIVGLREHSMASNSKDLDPRIAQTLRELLGMGLEVVLGEHDFVTPPELLVASAKPPTRLVPTHRLNLDLSVLIALVSDITHAPLPLSIEEANKRYIPNPAERERSRKRRLLQRERKEELVHSKAQNSAGKPSQNAKNKLKDKGKAEVTESEDDGESIQSRALASQVLREIDLSLLEEIAGRIPHPSSAVEFWTSKEARDRCIRIVSKIGGPAEKRRAAALFFDQTAGDVLGIRYVSPQHAADAYWRDSRHPTDLIPGLVPLRVFEDTDDGHLVVPSSVSGTIKSETVHTQNSFWVSLERTSARLLSAGSTSHPRSLSVFSTAGPSEKHDDEIERASVAKSNPRLTTHTISTLYRGARRRWTTLTANRASVREVIKECAKPLVDQGQSDSDLAGQVAELKLAGKAKGGEMEEKEEDAAIWVVEPRSLAESMRGDYRPV